MEILSPKKSRGILGIWQYNIYTFLKIGRSTSQWYASNHACSRLSETSIKRLYVGFTVMWGTGDPKTLTSVRGPHQGTAKKNYQWNRDLKILIKTRTNSCISVIHHRVLEMRLIDRNRMLTCITSWIWVRLIYLPFLFPLECLQAEDLGDYD